MIRIHQARRQSVGTRRVVSSLTLGLTVLLGGLLNPAHGVHYIDASATGTPEDGTTWNTAFRTITNAATTGGREFWVAEGSYTSMVPAGMEIRGNAFYGGFTNGMTSLDQRDWIAHPTILDGGGANRILAKSIAGSFILDGLILQNGYTNSTSATANGAALQIGSAGDGVIRNCIFSNNVTGASGAAIHFNSSKTRYSLSNCTFAANRSTGGGGALVYTKTQVTSEFVNCVFFANVTTGSGKDGGMLTDDQSAELTFRGCSFSNNVATQNGGAIRTNGRLILDTCDFVENVAKTAGGALYRTGTANTNIYRNCLFAGNLASGVGSTTGGGAIIDAPGAYIILTTILSNCTFLANSATNGSYGTGGAIRAGAAGSSTSILHVVNCLFWSNATTSVGSDMRLGGSTTLNLAYSDINLANISGGTTVQGAGLFSSNPLVARDSAPYDAHLQSAAGRFNPATGLWVKDAANSPCIDAGDPAADFSLEPANNGGRLNIGRYGNTLYASLSGSSREPTGAVIIVK